LTGLDLSFIGIVSVLRGLISVWIEI